MSSEEQYSYRRRKIGQELRRYREERNLTQDAAARLVERSPASLSAYENGHRAVRPRDLRQILDHYGVTDERERTRLLDLAAQGRKNGWWLGYRERTSPFIVDFASLEGDASRIRSFETLLIPGLLQTEAYTKAIFAADDTVRPEGRQAGGGVGFRMARQRILENASVKVTWIVSEAALRTPVGGAEVMKAQLKRILEVTSAAHLDLRVLPFAAGEHPGVNGAFTILDVGSEDPMRVVAVDGLTQSSHIDDPASVEYYERTHKVLTSIALPRRETRDLIDEIVFVL